MITKRELMDEIEMLKATVYNLRKYLDYALYVSDPDVKDILDDHFDGMPGYVDPEK